MKTGDIIAFKTKALWYNPLTYLGPIIRKIAKIKYNHVGIVIELYNKKFIFEAVDKGFLAKSLDEKLNDKKHIKSYKVLIPIYKFNENTLREEAIDLLSNKYDFKGLLFNQLILNLFNVWIGRNNNQKNKLYCYEAVFFLHREIFPDWWKTKPQEIFNNKNFEIL